LHSTTLMSDITFGRRYSWILFSNVQITFGEVPAYARASAGK